MNRFIFEPQSGLDTEYLNTLYGDQPDDAVEIFEMYLKETPGDVAELKMRFAGGDALAFAKQLHKMKAVFTYVGLPEVTEMVADLENECLKRADLNGLDESFRAITVRLESANAGIEQILRHLYTFVSNPTRLETGE